MAVYGNRVVEKLTFYQWINVEYGIVKRQYKELTDGEKRKLNENYKKYFEKNDW